MFSGTSGMGLATIGTEATISISIEVEEVNVKGEEVIIVAGYVWEEEGVGRR